MNHRIKIGFLDSGVGGISVLACARRYLPNVEFIYDADTDHVPYGTKTKEEIVCYVRDALLFFVRQHVDAVVIACNTATSMAVDEMRNEFSLPIVGMEPAVKPAAERHTGKKILVCATPLTIAGERLRKLIEHTGADSDLCALPELVTLAEKGDFTSPDVHRYLHTALPQGENYGAIVLGCTHFTFYRDVFQSLYPGSEIIDGNRGAVRRVADLLGIEMKKTASFEKGACRYYRSGREVTDEDDLAFLEMLESRMEQKYTEEEDYHG